MKITSSTVVYQLLTSYCAFSIATSPEQLWSGMQEKYGVLISHADNEKINASCHPLWLSLRRDISRLIQSTYTNTFLNEACIRNAMVRSGFEHTQLFEQVFLQKCIRSSTKQQLSLAQDTQFGGTAIDCPALSCSANTLGHLYYAARILEATYPEIPHIIIEFGGGYGNLARLLKQAIPTATIAIFDIPEMICLQWFFLKNTTSYHIVIHDSAPDNLESGAINLISVEHLDSGTLSCDVFVSTFALSEASLDAQNTIVNKHFFNAQTCYLAGQIDGWSNTLKFNSHELLINAIHAQYTTIYCSPFHHFGVNVLSYEIIAKN